MKEIFIVGLGNPGKNYQNTRHNIGFLLLKEFSNKYSSNFTFKNKLKSYFSEFKINNTTYKLFLPNTFMNNSGDAVKVIVDWYKINLSQLYVIVDDIDIPLGKIRFRKKGSSVGHNGLKDIIEKLNTKDFKRVRVGIGSPECIKSDFNTVSHVLGNISSKEKETLDKVYKYVIESLEQLSIKEEDYMINKLNSFNREQI